MAIQEDVVEVPSTLLHLLRMVTRVVLCYREAVETTATEEVEDQA